MTVVGLVERFDASLALASRRLGMPLRAMVIPPKNVGKRFTARERLDAALFAKVAKACDADMELFHWAEDFFEAELRSLGRLISLSVGGLRLANLAARGLAGRGRRLAGKLHLLKA